MSTQFSNELLNGLLAPGIAELVEITAPELGDEFAEELHWTSNLFLNSIFHATYKRPFYQATITFIVRTQAAMRAYRAARQLGLDLLAASKPGSPASRTYFETVTSWETCLFNVQIALDLVLEFLAPDVIATDDANRIRQSVNRVKHFAEDMKKAKTAAEQTIPLWLERDRLRTRQADVTYDELLEAIREMARTADILQHPRGEKENADEAAH